MTRSYFFVPIISLTLALSWGIAFGDEEYSFWNREQGVAPVTNALYKEECGSCHFAYQPGLLPERSWKKIMSGLANHFGDNAELSAGTSQQILAYLANNSADKVNDRRSRSIMRSISPSSTPLRITDVAYIKHQHNEIPRRFITGNDKVSSLSRCEACHQTAQQGLYSEGNIRIPGVGRWDD